MTGGTDNSGTHTISAVLALLNRSGMANGDAYPRNGAKVAEPEKAVPAFKASRDMHRQLTPSEA